MFDTDFYIYSINNLPTTSRSQIERDFNVNLGNFNGVDKIALEGDDNGKMISYAIIVKQNGRVYLDKYEGNYAFFLHYLTIEKYAVNFSGYNKLHYNYCSTNVEYKGKYASASMKSTYLHISMDEINKIKSLPDKTSGALTKNGCDLTLNRLSIKTSEICLQNYPYAFFVYRKDYIKSMANDLKMLLTMCTDSNEAIIVFTNDEIFVLSLSAESKCLINNFKCQEDLITMLEKKMVETKNIEIILKDLSPFFNCFRLPLSDTSCVISTK